MPIRAENKHRYPPEWPLISLWVRVCAGWRCEWCNIEQGAPLAGGWRVVLTVAHVNDPSPENVTPGNLAALCQRCHLGHDRKHHAQTRAQNQRKAMLTADLLGIPCA